MALAYVWFRGYDDSMQKAYRWYCQVNHWLRHQYARNNEVLPQMKQIYRDQFQDSETCL